MFKIEDNNVMYKTPNMVNWIQYGTVLTASIKQETDSSYIYQVLKFNLDTDTYELDTTVSDYYLDGKRYEVINGEFEVVKEKESISEQERLKAEILLNQCNLLINQENQDKVLAEILLNQMGV